MLGYADFNNDLMYASAKTGQTLQPNFLMKMAP